MSRFTMVLAAAVATAMLVVAVSALDAVGADPPAKASSTADLDAKLADCLRDRGVAIPAVTGAALDDWLRTHRLPDATVRACKMAVAPPEAAPSADATHLSQCLKAQGLDVPTDPAALKKWIGNQSSRTALDALKKCGLTMKPDPILEQKPAPCGEDAAQPTDTPKTPRPDASGVTADN